MVFYDSLTRSEILEYCVKEDLIFLKDMLNLGETGYAEILLKGDSSFVPYSSQTDEQLIASYVEIKRERLRTLEYWIKREISEADI